MNKKTQNLQSFDSFIPIKHLLFPCCSEGEFKLEEIIRLSSGKPPSIRTRWLIVFWTLGLMGPSSRLYLLCKVELAARSLRCPKRGIPTEPSIFGPATHESRLVCGPHYKMVLYRILAWWELGYIPGSIGRILRRILFSFTIFFKPSSTHCLFPHKTG